MWKTSFNFCKLFLVLANIKWVVIWTAMSIILCTSFPMSSRWLKLYEPFLLLTSQSQVWDMWCLFIDFIFYVLAIVHWEHILYTLSFQAQTPTFCAAVLDSLAIELNGSANFSKLYTGIAIFGYIASVPESIHTRAFSELLTFLGHPYPKVILKYSSTHELRFSTLFFCLKAITCKADRVCSQITLSACILASHTWVYYILSLVKQIRKASAEQVYLVLLQNGNLVAEDKIEKALEIISETCWDDDIDLIKHQKLEFFELVGLEVGPSVKNSDGTTWKTSTKKPENLDENATYSSLVESSGFWFLLVQS